MGGLTWLSTAWPSLWDPHANPLSKYTDSVASTGCLLTDLHPVSLYPDGGTVSNTTGRPGGAAGLSASCWRRTSPDACKSSQANRIYIAPFVYNNGHLMTLIMWSRSKLNCFIINWWDLHGSVFPCNSGQKWTQKGIWQKGIIPQVSEEWSQRAEAVSVFIWTSDDCRSFVQVSQTSS